ncbi:MAG: hypothetical protein ABIG31_05360 [Candidatus Omnitrophota bacterium]
MTKEGLKRITEIKIGDEICAFDQNNHQMVIKKCSGVFDNGRKEVFELKTLYYSIKATANHPFLVLQRNEKGGHSSLVWKMLKDVDIATGDRVVTLKSMNDDTPFRFLDLHKRMSVSKISTFLPQEQKEKFVGGLMLAEEEFLPDNKFFQTEEVLSIKSKGVEPTLDLRIEEEHNFIADGIVVHNTGIQRSGLTPFHSATTTSPFGRQSFGNIRPKKPMPEIALAHGIPYVATTSAGFMQDLQRKVKKALSIKGPKYLQIHVPCPLGWRHEPNLTLAVAKCAVETGLYPLIEYEGGALVSRRQITPKPVQEYLKVQGRFKHLLNAPEEIRKIQEIADHNIEKYGLSEKSQIPNSKSQTNPNTQ